MIQDLGRQLNTCLTLADIKFRCSITTSKITDKDEPHHKLTHSLPHGHKNYVKTRHLCTKKKQFSCLCMVHVSPHADETEGEPVALLYVPGEQTSHAEAPVKTRNAGCAGKIAYVIFCLWHQMHANTEWNCGICHALLNFNTLDTISTFSIIAFLKEILYIFVKPIFVIMNYIMINR